jgi:Flp pilus assembly protein TadD
VDTYRDRFRANPKDAEAALQYGKALRATGQRSQAVAVLEQATLAEPDNKALLAGYGRALAEEPSVLSNLGLSYVLSKDLPKAEQTLRRAYGRADADPRVRQNLALVVGLQGRLAEAEGIVKSDQPAEVAAANVAYLRRLLSRKDSARVEGSGSRATAD